MASLAEYIEAQREKRRKKNLLGAPSIVEEGSDDILTEDEPEEEAAPVEGGQSPIEKLKLDGPATEEVPAEQAGDVSTNLGFSGDAEETPFSPEELQEGAITAQRPSFGTPEQKQDKSKYQKYVQAAQSGNPAAFKRSFQELNGQIPMIPNEVDREKFKAQRDELLAKYEEAKQSNEWGQVADLIGQGLVKLGAGLYGMKHGVDVSGVKFNSFDWEKRLDRLRKDLDSGLAESHKQEASEDAALKDAYTMNRQNIGDTQAEELALSKEGRDSEAENRAQTKFAREEEAYDPFSPKAEGLRGILLKSDKEGKYPKDFLNLLGYAELKDLQTSIQRGESFETWLSKQAVLHKNRLQADEVKQGAIGARQDKAGIANTVRSYENDVQIKKSKEQESALQNITEMIAAAKGGNQLAQGSLGTAMAKLSGEVGALTENDVKRYVEGQTYWRQMSDALKKRVLSGRVTDASLGDAQGLLELYRSVINGRKNEIRERYVNQAYENYGKYQGYNRDEVESKFGVNPTGQNLRSGKLKVQKGKEILEIDASDLEAAKADGYEQVK